MGNIATKNTFADIDLQIAMDNIPTKNTFVHIDTSQYDGSTKDSRKIKSCPGPAPSRCKEDRAGGSYSGKGIEGTDSLDSNEPAEDWTTDMQRAKANGSLKCEDVVRTMEPGYNAEPQEHSASAIDACIGTTQLAASAPATKQKGFSWSSYDISDAARKALQDRSALAANRAFAEDGAVALPGAQLPTLFTSRRRAANDNSQFCKPKRFTTSLATVRTEDTVMPGNVIPDASWTCRMVRHIPIDYTRSDVLELLDAHGLSFDFVYLPIDWRKKANLGYAFVNFVSHEEAKNCAEVLNGYKSWRVPSEKVCEVVWGREDQQGLHKNIDRFKNSPVMHPDIPEEFKPLLFTLGQRTAFPAPTERLKRDRRLTSSWWQTSACAAHSPVELEPEPRGTNA